MNHSASQTFSIVTPPAGAIDPRRVGVRPLGSYWGAMGEQIDTMSGNLNFSLPLVKALGRGGWGVTFRLSYNSQLWRQDNSVDWKLGEDVGYGFGWKLLAGSLTPYWQDYYNIHHYTFTDSTGAEYRLDVNTNGIWSSRQGVYVSYGNQILIRYKPAVEPTGQIPVRASVRSRMCAPGLFPSGLITSTTTRMPSHI